MATHAVLSDPAVDRLKNSALTKVVVTNTLPIPQDRRFDKLEVLSVARLISDAIDAVFEDTSGVGDLRRREPGVGLSRGPQGSADAAAFPLNTSRPSWVDGGHGQLDQPVAVLHDDTGHLGPGVRVSPGHTWARNRPPKRARPPSPTVSVSMRPVIAMVSIPWANTVGNPATRVTNTSSVWSGLKSPDAPAYCTIWVR